MFQYSQAYVCFFCKYVHRYAQSHAHTQTHARTQAYTHTRITMMPKPIQPLAALTCSLSSLKHMTPATLPKHMHISQFMFKLPWKARHVRTHALVRNTLTTIPFSFRFERPHFCSKRTDSTEKHSGSAMPLSSSRPGDP